MNICFSNDIVIYGNSTFFNIKIPRKLTFVLTNLYGGILAMDYMKALGMDDEIYSEENKTILEFYKTILSQMMDGFALHKIIFDIEEKPVNYKFLYVNPAFEVLTGLKKDEILGKKVSEIIPDIREDEFDWIGAYGNVATKGEPLTFESFSKHIGKWYSIHAYSPKRNYFVTIFNDITQVKRKELDLQERNEELSKAQEKLQYLASYDPLTELPNSRSLLINIKARLAKSPDSNMVLFYIDFDNFNFINSTLGHSFGEKFVVKIGDRLSSIFHNDHEIYRLHGAEFILILYNFTSKDEVKACAKRMIQCFQTPLDLEDCKLHTTVNIGIAMYPGQGNNTEALIRNANISMNNAKKIGKNMFAFYTEDMHHIITERLIIEKHLYTALENHEFEIHYQPQLDLTTKKICGFEALLRWHNQDLGSIPPSVFIVVAEFNHLIIPIGEWVLRNACYFIKKLQNKGHTEFTVAVNVSVIQLMQDDFVDSVFRILDLINLEPKYLELEITESVFIESHDVIFEKLMFLRDRGIIIALDDFGKEYSALGDLQYLPIDILKVDKTFIDSILNNDKHVCIADMIIMLGRKMGMTVLAEGVETQEQMDYLIQNQCHRMQGFLFSKPVPGNEILYTLNKKSEDDTYIYGFEWMAKYSIHIDSIDAQHKKMFGIGNKLSKHVFSEESFNEKELRSIFQELKDYTEYHFKYEEDYMLAYGYAYLETHKGEHKIFIERVQNAYANLNNYMEKDYLVYLIDMVSVWISNHILREDLKFGNFLSNR